MRPRFLPSRRMFTRARGRPNITIFFTLLAVGVSFAWLGVEDPSRWQAGVVLYILGRECARPLVLIGAR